MKRYHIGITVGVFDLLHVGHLNLIERCKSMCDHLIVAICDDDYVTSIKHKSPVYPQNERIRLLTALRDVDEVVLVSVQEVENKLMLLAHHPFDVLFSGDDWRGSERYLKTEKEFADKGVSIEYFPYTRGISSSDIKGRIVAGQNSL